MNNVMTPINAPMTMTSLEMVDFINEDRKSRAEAEGVQFPSAGFAKLEHSDFMKKVPEVLSGGVGKFSDTYVHPQNGQTYPCYRFPKREACLMAMSYSYELQAKVFDRMTELDRVVDQPRVPQSMPEALRLAAEAIEQRDQLVLENKVQAEALAVAQPKVDGFDRIAKSDGSLCLTDAAKTLQIQPRKLTQLLQEKGWVYRRPMGSGWLAYQGRIQSGHLEHKITTGEKSDGSEWSSTQVRVTARGLTKLADVVRQAGMH